MTPEGRGGQAVEPAPARRGGRARDASSRAADWTWGIFRRIHLGTRKPENWMQLFKFGVVGGSGYVINLIVFAVLGLEPRDGRIASADYPDGLARLWSTLNAPNAGDVVVSLETGYECVDWGGTSHVGGGSHGALLAGDSLGPLLLCGLEPGGGDTREQWTLRDVAGLVCDHFGIGDDPEVRAADVAGAVR